MTTYQLAVGDVQFVIQVGGIEADEVRYLLPFKIHESDDLSSPELKRRVLLRRNHPFTLDLPRDGMSSEDVPILHIVFDHRTRSTCCQLKSPPPAASSSPMASRMAVVATASPIVVACPSRPRPRTALDRG